MPLLKRDPPTIDDVPVDLKDASLETLVFQIPFTGEIYSNYGDFDAKMIYYLQPVWTCQKSSKLNLTFEEALQSEKRVQAELDDWFPDCWVKPALELIHYNCNSLNKVADELFDFFTEHVFVGEYVWVEPLLVSHSSMYGKIDAEVPYSEIKEGFFHKGIHTPKMVAKPAARPEVARQGTRHSSRGGAKKEIVEEAVQPEMPTEGVAYRVRLYKSWSTIPLTLEENKGKPVELIVERHKFHRDRRALSKTLFRKFIRERATKDTLKESPFMVSDEDLERYKLQKEPGPQAQDYLNRKAAIVNKERLKCLLAQTKSKSAIAEEKKLQQNLKQQQQLGGNLAQPLLGINSTAVQALSLSMDPSIFQSMMQLTIPRASVSGDSLGDSPPDEERVITTLPRTFAVSNGSQANGAKTFVPPGLQNQSFAMLNGLTQLLTSRSNASSPNGSNGSLDQQDSGESANNSDLVLPNFSGSRRLSQGDLRQQSFVFANGNNGLPALNVFNGLTGLMNSSGAAFAAAAAAMFPMMNQVTPPAPTPPKPPLFPMEDLDLFEHDYEKKPHDETKPENASNGTVGAPLSESVKENKEGCQAVADGTEQADAKGALVESKESLQTESATASEGAVDDAEDIKYAEYLSTKSIPEGILTSGLDFIEEEHLPMALNVWSFVIANRPLLKLDNLEITFQEFCECLHDDASLASLNPENFHDDDSAFEESLLSIIFSGIMTPVAGDFYWNMRNGGKPSTGGLIDALRYCHSSPQLHGLAQSLDSADLHDESFNVVELGYGVKVAKAMEKIAVQDTAESRVRMLKNASIFSGTLSSLSTKDRAMLGTWCRWAPGKIIPPPPRAKATVMNKGRILSSTRRTVGSRQQIQIQYKQLLASDERQLESHIGWELSLVGCIKDTMMDSEYKFDLLNRLFPSFEEEPAVYNDVEAAEDAVREDEETASKKRKLSRETVLRSGKRRAIEDDGFGDDSMEDEKATLQERLERAKEKSEYFWLAKRCSQSFFQQTTFAERLNILKFLIDDVLVAGGSYHERLETLVEPLIMLHREKRELLRARQLLLADLKANSTNSASIENGITKSAVQASNGDAKSSVPDVSDKSLAMEALDELSSSGDDGDDLESLTPIPSEDDDSMVSSDSMSEDGATADKAKVQNMGEDDLNDELEDLVGEKANPERTRLNERQIKLEEEKQRLKEKENELVEFREKSRALKLKRRELKRKIEEANLRLSNIDLELRLISGQRRMSCLGMDRFFNKYYWFDSYIKDSFANDCSLAIRDENGRTNSKVPSTGYSPFGKIIVEDAGLDSTMDSEAMDRIFWGNYQSKWRYIDSKEGFEKLLSWLDTRGVRERELERNLKLLHVPISETLELLQSLND